jgi:hypothetical protein
VTDGQQKFVITVLMVLLAYNMLDWTSQFRHEDWTPIFIFYQDLDPLGHVEKWGLYTRRGEVGVILGAVVPLCLFAIAAYWALKLRLKNVARRDIRPRACTHKRTATKLTWMSRPTSVRG